MSVKIIVRSSSRECCSELNWDASTWLLCFSERCQPQSHPCRLQPSETVSRALLPLLALRSALRRNRAVAIVVSLHAETNAQRKAGPARKRIPCDCPNCVATGR